MQTPVMAEAETAYSLFYVEHASTIAQFDPAIRELVKTAFLIGFIDGNKSFLEAARRRLEVPLEARIPKT